MASLPVCRVSWQRKLIFMSSESSEILRVTCVMYSDELRYGRTGAHSVGSSVAQCWRCLLVQWMGGKTTNRLAAYYIAETAGTWQIDSCRQRCIHVPTEQSGVWSENYRKFQGNFVLIMHYHKIGNFYASIEWGAILVFRQRLNRLSCFLVPTQTYDSLFLSASLYVSKRGAYWDRLCRDVVGRWLVSWLVVGRWLSRAYTVAKRCILGL